MVSLNEHVLHKSIVYSYKHVFLFFLNFTNVVHTVNFIDNAWGLCHYETNRIVINTFV